MSQTADVAIVGGGVIGCAIAYYLTRQGIRVSVIERGELGSESSGAAAGILNAIPGDFDEGMPHLQALEDLRLASFRMFPQLVADLHQETGLDTEYQRCGILRLALTESEAQASQAYASQEHAHGLPLHWLSRDELLALEPRLTPSVHGALYSPEEGQINPHRLVQVLARAVELRGSSVLQGTPVTGFRGKHGRVVGIRAGNHTLAVGQVVLAAGSWTGSLSARLGLPLPVRPRRGQMIAYGGQSLPVRHVIAGAHGYLAPKVNGLLYAGATVDDVGFRRNTTRQALAWLKALARTLVPQLAHAEIMSFWSGLRPGTIDGLPILGRLPGFDNVFIATGHFRNGILLSPVTGQIMANWITVGSPGAPLDAFSPDRFTPVQERAR